MYRECVGGMWKVLVPSALPIEASLAVRRPLLARVTPVADTERGDRPATRGTSNVTTYIHARLWIHCVTSRSPEGSTRLWTNEVSGRRWVGGAKLLARVSSCS